MQLGRGPGNGPIISAAKYLDVLPFGAIIRNGCDSDDHPAEGVHFIKIPSHRHQSGTEWAAYWPRTGTISPVEPIQSCDVYLPVQQLSRAELLQTLPSRHD